MKKQYRFYGHENATCHALPTSIYKGIETPLDLYDAMSEIWCEYSCAPRLRSKWSKENMTLGQCSTTAFLAQDIFGGKVFGIRLEDGAYHCFNVVGDCVFDLTSEQFGDEVLDYEHVEEQFRETHFAMGDKKDRYEYLCRELLKRCSK